jgi:hypothetical protein
MAEESTPLEAGTYEVLRARLDEQARDLRERLQKLNAARQDVFGTIETALVATERVTTGNNCIPRDMIAIGANRFLFGYNVHIGLRAETKIEDVFSAYEWAGREFRPVAMDFLRDPNFEADFRELFKYYRQTVFAKFSVIGPHLFFVFQIGQSVTDIKTFKWLVAADGGLAYLGNRSDHECVFPAQHEFEWRRTHRDLHRKGAHPHISIEDRVFVETIGGDLTIKIEDNTDSGEGIYSEPVDHRDQTLDDAEVFYAAVGNLILLRIRPYQEKAFRYFIFNDKLKQVHRVDAIEQSCVLLPDGHGIIFSRGYYLQTGELKLFDANSTDMLFERRITAPNREDHLICFHNQERGDYILMPYNVITQRVETPLHCHGFSLFENGELALFKAEAEPRKHHAVQIWQTPFTGPAFQTPAKTDSHLFKIGNGEIVRCMAEAHEMLAMLARDEPYASLYMDLRKKAGDMLDSYFWLRHEAACGLAVPLEGIREAAGRTVEEFDKVLELRRAAADRLKEVGGRASALVARAIPGTMRDIDAFVHALADLRGLRGEVIALREVRYIDLPAVDRIEADVSARTGELSQECVQFLLTDEALAPYRLRIEAFGSRIDGVQRAVDGRALEEEMTAAGAELGLLIEIVGNLRIDDATETTRILDCISAIYAQLNQLLARLRQRLDELRGREGAAQFAAQLNLIAQSVTNLLDRCDTPDRCDEALGRVMAQLEELEARFADSEEFLVPLAGKRNEVVAAFEARKLALVEARNRKATALLAVADRVLKGMQTRVTALRSVAEIEGFFASDLMAEKLREVIQQLLDLGDPVKADDAQGRLKALREDAVRQLKDRQELFVNGSEVVAFGAHRFNVNTQQPDLTVLQKDGGMFLHLAGTRFFEPLESPGIEALRPVWELELISESPEVYRAEWLAYQVLRQWEAAGVAKEISGWDADRYLAAAREFMESRYAESYVRGVHDADAARILGALAPMQIAAGLVRHAPAVRALAVLAWENGPDGAERDLLVAQLASHGAMRAVFARNERPAAYLERLRAVCRHALAAGAAFDEKLVPAAAEYLFDAISAGGQFAFSRDAFVLFREFEADLKATGVLEKFAELRKAVAGNPWRHLELLRDWLDGWLAKAGGARAAYRDEAALLLMRGEHHTHHVLDVELRADLAGLLGQHPRITGGGCALDFLDFMERLGRHEQETAPAFARLQELKRQAAEDGAKRLRIDEFRPRVLTSFVRNRLVDEVFLPLVGANLAKQMGTAGANTRTDRMGLLLLVSPPGYGKTTLMEYVASRLGLVFMKINGPSIGAAVTSFDPAQAPNAAAREELVKLNLAFEMGDNVMIYVDDIQHCHSEFLQKFISLCDGQRRVEGVHRGVARTYDLRGRKVAVVMAGNPYTESGEKFRIPDMLANRADTYNLGDMAVGAHFEAFKLSYLENALTSNAVLNPLASRGSKDILGIVRIAETGGRDGVELEGAYSARELEDMVSVVQKLARIRDVILTVNAEYIRSAAQADAYRTEPPFRLQGSYRNMNRMAEKVVPVMNDAELEALIMDHYRNEAQTLTTGAESNLLKLRELLGKLSPEDAARLADIRKTFARNLMVAGADGDSPVAQVVRQLAAFHAGLDGIRDALASAARERGNGRSEVPEGIDLTKVAISRETLQKIWELIEQDRSSGGPMLEIEVPGQRD